MKLNKKITAIGAAAFILIGIGITVSMLCLSSSKTVKIAFHGISSDQEMILKDLIAGHSKENDKVEFKFLELNGNTETLPQLKKADIVFTHMGLEADRLVDSIPEGKRKSVYFDSSVISGTSISAAEFAMTTKGSGEKKVSQVPLVFDGYELLLSTQALKETKTSSISSWTDVENFALKAKSVFSGIAFAGGDADSLLGVLSSLIESFDGKEKYCNLIEKIGSHEGTAETLIAALLEEDDAFHDAMHRLLSWKKKGILKTSILDKNKDELSLILDRYKNAVVIMPLSETRRLSQDTVKYLTTLPIFSNENNFYFPSMRPLNTRAVMSSVLAMICLSEKSYARDSVNFLLGVDAQERLAFGTGLAPMLANSKIPDIQSDDLRFWIAATSAPVISMGQAAFDSEQKKEDFANAVREWIRNTN